MKISEKQLHQLLYIVQTFVINKKQIDITSLSDVIDLINEIFNQQSKELKEVS